MNIFAELFDASRSCLMLPGTFLGLKLLDLKKRIYLRLLLHLTVFQKNVHLRFSKILRDFHFLIPSLALAIGLGGTDKRGHLSVTLAGSRRGESLSWSPEQGWRQRQDPADPGHRGQGSSPACCVLTVAGKGCLSGKDVKS